MTETLFSPVRRLTEVLYPPRRRSRPGAAPGTVLADPSAEEPSIQVIGFGPETLEEAVLGSAVEVHQWIERFPVLWVNIEGLGDASTIETIGDAFDFHPLALEDVVHSHQRPKVEAYDDHLFVVCRMARATEELDTEQLSLFLGGNFVVTFQEKKGDMFDPVRERLRKPQTRLRTSGPGYLTYALLDAVVDFYFPVLERLGDRLESIEQSALVRPYGPIVRQIHAVKRDLLLLRRAIWPLRDMLRVLWQESGGLIDEATQVYIRDCHDHIFQIIDLVEVYREISSGLVDLHLSSLGNRTNEIMKVLTIFAAIFIPLTFVAGIYGMNFDPSVSPWNMPELGWYYGYPFALGIMALIGGGLLYYFVRRGWIGSQEYEPADLAEHTDAV